jgi:uncharacterized protein (TIGR04141 family)
MTVPEIINYTDNLYATFSGAGESLIYDDVYISRYYDYLEAHGVDLASIDLAALKRHDLVLTDEAGSARDRYSVFKSMVFDLAVRTENLDPDVVMMKSAEDGV